MNESPPADVRRFGDRLEWAIKTHLGVSKAEFARRLQVHPPQLSNWLSRDEAPSEDTVRKISELTELPASWLRYGGVGAPAEERPEDAVYDPAEGTEKYDPTAETAEMLFGQLEKWIRGMGGEGDMAQAKLRRLDALEGLRRFFSARGPVPDWWYDIKAKVEDGQL